MILRISIAAAVLLLAGAARADEHTAARAHPDAGVKGGKAARKPPLSAEDAALVKELALIERVELLQHLELFEDAPADANEKEGKP